MATVVHVGPTLRHDEVRRIIPDAVVAPPVAAGDLVRGPARRGDVVVIIDGYFHHRAAVRHKEIVHLVERGVEVWGTASMGALRAAELTACGMHGCGAVFRLYRRDVLEGDDEVAVTHGPAAIGYPTVAEALVTIRYTLRALVRRGLLPRDHAGVLLDAAQRLPFMHRTPDQLRRAAVAAGMLEQAADRAVRLVQEHRVDVKRRDALRTLRRVANRQQRPRIEGSAGSAVVGGPPPANDNTRLRMWVESHRTRAGVTELFALGVCQLYTADFPVYAAPRQLRMLAALASPPARRSDDELLDDFMAAQGCCAAEVGAWCEAHDLELVELLRHLRLQARIATYDDSALAATILAEARRRGVLQAEDTAWWAPHWLRVHEMQRPDAALVAARRMLVIPPAIPPRAALLTHIKLSGHFRPAHDTARRALSHHAAGATVSTDDDIVAWYARHWSCPPAEFDLELRDRGFVSRQEFLGMARMLHPYQRDRAGAAQTASACPA